MRRILVPDDIRKGLFMTVHRGRVRTGMNGQQMEYRDFKGDVLEVIAVDLPYIVVLRHDCSGRDPRKVILNCQEEVFMRLTNEYVQACCPGVAPSKEDPDLAEGDMVLSQNPAPNK